MEFRHLRYFIAVGEEQNVTRAAARLNVAQPSLSRQMRDLEGLLGVPLLEHGAKAVRLTDAGRVFLEEARAVVARLEEAVRSTKAVAQGEAGELHVGFAPSLAVELLPRILRQFQQSHPKVRVQLHDLSTTEMLRRLRERTLHHALLMRFTEQGMSDLDFAELEQHAVCVAMHPEHPLASVQQPGLKHLLEERLVAFTLADYPEYHAWISGMFAGLPHPPRIVEEHDSVVSLIAAVEAGKGVAVVSQRMDCLSGSRLKVRPLHPALPPLCVGIAMAKCRQSAVAASFVAHAKALVATVG